MSSFTPHKYHFIGAEKVRKGTDWIRSYQFLDSTGLPIDMSQYGSDAGGVVRVAVKSEDLVTTYLSSAAGSMGVLWDAADPSILNISATDTATAALSGVIPNSAVYQVEAVSGTSSLTDRILEGRIEMDSEVVTTST
jgi:hypothetical protein